MITITDVYVRDHSVLVDAVGTSIRMFTSIDRMLPVPFLPIERALSFSFILTADAKSIVRFSAELVSPDGTKVFAPLPSWAAEPGSADIALPSTLFTLKTAGIYTFRLLVDRQSKWSSELEVIVGP